MRFALATPADDADVRRLLRENPMPGDIAISLEREPDSSLAAALEGDVHHAIIARDGCGAAIAVGGVTVRDRYVNGQLQRVGYLGQLRLDHRCRARARVLLGGYAMFRELHRSLGARLYFTSIAADNHRARRFLERGLPGMPTYRPLEPFVTSLFPMQAPPPSRRAAGLKIDEAAPEQIGDVLSCLERNGRRFQLSPHWQPPDLEERARRGEVELIVASRGGRVVGCVGAWDQSGCKQTVVRGYAPRLARWRHVLNFIGPLAGVPHLPPVGTALNLMYLSHLAVDDDDPDVFAELLRYACSPTDRWLGEENRSYFVLGLSERHPLARAIPRRFRRRRAYRTNLYAVHWPDDWPEGAAAADALDGRPCHPEVALL